MSRFGMIGSGLLLSGMCTISLMSWPDRPRDPRMMWMTSLWPRVVSKPTFAPRRWMIALVPAVVPCASIVIDLSNAGSSSPTRSPARCSASSTPSAKLPGVDGALEIVSRPPSSMSTQSVNVPPISRPQR